MTNYSGNVEFFNPSKEFIGKSAVLAMNEVIKNDCRKQHGEEMAKLVHEEFGDDNIGYQIAKLVEESLPLIVKKQNKE